MTGNITIRPATEADYPALLSLFGEFAAFERVPEKMTNTMERMLAEKEHIRALVASDQRAGIIGYAAYFFGYYTWSGKSLYLDDLFVKPAWRGKGTGTRLLREVIDLAKSSGCHLMRWQVSDWNISATELYRRIGATIDREKQNCDLKLDTL